MKIVCLGDSITLGIRPGVTNEQTFEFVLEHIFAESGVSVEILNAGIGSEKTDEGLARFTEAVIDKCPDCVIIMYGTNDSAVNDGLSLPRLSVAEYERNLLEMVSRARGAGIVPVLMTPIPLGDHWLYTAWNPYKENGPNCMIEFYVDTVRKISVYENVLLIDHHAAWREWEKRTGLSIEKLQVDSCHPNPDGHKLIAEMMYHILTPDLERE